MKRFLKWLRSARARAFNLPDVGQLRVATSTIPLKKWSPPYTSGIIRPGTAFTIVDGVTHFSGVKGMEYTSYDVITSNEQAGTVTDWDIKRRSSIAQEAL